LNDSETEERHSLNFDEEEDEACHPHSYEDDNQFCEQLSAIGLVLRDVPSDGNCMFHAFSDQLFGTFEKHALLRWETVNFLRNHKRELLPFCEEDEFDDVLHDLAKPGTFGDHTSLIALARLYSVDVIVHQVGLHPIYVAYSPFRDHWTRQVHLALHSIQHYSSVRNPNKKDGPANVHIDPSKIFSKPEIKN
uniref:OTU domain-containing protein n=1 Tax=Schistocephalus solidus TaxID=70667 RepID=A0A183S797_SCHSO